MGNKLFAILEAFKDISDPDMKPVPEREIKRAEGEKKLQAGEKITADEKKALLQTAIAKIDANRPLNETDKKALINHFNFLGNNSKTVASIDFMAGTPKRETDKCGIFPGGGGTCSVNCKYCYVLQSFKMGREGQIEKFTRIGKIAKEYPDVYKEGLKIVTKEFFKKNPNVPALRWFGSGDYQPWMKEAIIELAKEVPDKKFYIISKTLVNQYAEDIVDLINASPNIFINLSFDKMTINYIKQFEHLRQNNPRLRLAYTLDRFEGMKFFRNGVEIPESEITQKAEIQSALTKMKGEKLKEKRTSELIARFAKVFQRSISEGLLCKPIEEAIISGGENFWKIFGFEDKPYQSYPNKIVMWVKNKEIAKQIRRAFNRSSLKNDFKMKEPKEYNPTDSAMETNIIRFIPKDEKEQPEINESSSSVKQEIQVSKEYMEKLKNIDVIFNVNRNKAFIQKYKDSGLHFCLCDVKEIAHHGACVSEQCTESQCWKVNLLHQIHKPTRRKNNGTSTI